MQFQLPFEKEIFQRQMALILKHVTKNIVKQRNKSLYWGLGALLFGLLGLNVMQNFLMYIMIGLGVFSLLSFVSLQSQYSKYKSNYSKIAEEETKGQLNAGVMTVFEFHDDYFRYADYKCELKYIWPIIKGYDRLDDTLLLYINSDKIPSFSLSKEEIDADDFEALIAFVDTKAVCLQKRLAP